MARLNSLITEESIYRALEIIFRAGEILAWLTIFAGICFILVPAFYVLFIR